MRLELKAGPLRVAKSGALVSTFAVIKGSFTIDLFDVLDARVRRTGGLAQVLADCTLFAKNYTQNL